MLFRSNWLRHAQSLDFKHEVLEVRRAHAGNRCGLSQRNRAPARQLAPRFDAQGSHLLIWGFVRQTKRRQRLQARRTFTLASEVAGVLDLELDRGECVVVVGIGRPGGVEDIAQVYAVALDQVVRAYGVYSLALVVAFLF